MSSARRLLSYSWVVPWLLALGILGAINLGRVRQVDRLTNLTATVPAVDAASPTGYANGVRMLLVPGHNNESYQWIAQTQAMIATGQGRLRHADYDNAPAGRPVYSASLYRWWLGALARVHHQTTGQPIGLSVERMARWADPLLQLLLVGIGTILVVRRFGAWPAAGFALATASLYPLGGAFLPGSPDDIGLGLLLAIASGLTLLAGALPPDDAPAGTRRWFVTSGILGGIGLWLNVGLTIPVLVGFGLGALGGEWLVRRTAPALPWRAWSLAGAATSLLAWLVEYAPVHLSFAPARLAENHLVYALAWWGGGEFLARASARFRCPVAGSGLRRHLVPLLAATALVAPATIMLWSGTRGFLTPDTFALRLTALDESGEASNFFKWAFGGTAGWQVLAVLLPLALLIPVGQQLLRRDTGAGQRRALALAVLPALVALGFSCGQISWWNQVDAVLLVLLVALLGREAASLRRGIALLAVALPGLVLLWPGRPAGPAELTEQEHVQLAERDLAHWLARHAGAGGTLALAPPNLTVSLYYHGGGRGLGSPYRENEAGFLASIRLAGATTADEAHALVRQRQVTHILIPPWDDFLDEYARLGSGRPEHALIQLLHRWLPPRWLRPVPYYLPEGTPWRAPCVIFETVELQDGATALSRLTEYFIDMGNIELATLAARALAADYGSDLGAQVAKARTEVVRRDAKGFAQSLAAIAAGLEEGSAEALAWDRRVSLAIVLAEGNRVAPARAQAQRCLEQMGEPELRSLSEPVLFRFLTLCKALGLEVDESLRQRADELLSPRLRKQI